MHHLNKLLRKKIIGNILDEEPFKKWWKSRTDREPDHGLEVRVSRLEGETEYTSYKFELRYNQMVIMRMMFSPYPSCCALLMMHSFQYNDFSGVFTKEQFQQIVKLVMQEIPPRVGYWASRRLIVMMVSYGGLQFSTENLYTGIPKEHEARPEYPWFYDYFKAQKQCNEKLMYNENTGNVIHELEVLFDRTNFPQYANDYGA